jgi:hypothetical protein
MPLMTDQSQFYAPASARVFAGRPDGAHRMEKQRRRSAAPESAAAGWKTDLFST